MKTQPFHQPEGCGPALPTQHPAPAYRPLSGLAVAGFGLALLFAMAVVGIGITALVTGMPLLIGWMLVVAVAGAALSLAGRIQVRRSEGTRAGLALAKWGWWLSVVFGLGYSAYLAGTEWAIRQQARDFSEAWIDKVSSDPPQAFLWTLAPARREGDNPRDVRRLHARYLLSREGQKGPWPLYLEQQLVRLIEQAGADGRIEYLGVERWQFENGGYLVEQNFRLTTPEGTYDFRLPVWGGESRKTPPEYEGRKWFIYVIDAPLSAQPKELTPFGTSLLSLRRSAGRFVEDWGRLLQDGRFEEPFLATLEPRAREQAAAQYVAGLAGTVGLGAFPAAGLSEAVLLGNPAETQRMFLPGYEPFADGAWVVTRNLVADNDAIRAGIRKLLPDLFRLRPAGERTMITLPPEFRAYDSLWKLDGDRLRLFQPVQIHLGSKYFCEAVAEVVAEDPGLAPQLEKLRQAARDGSPSPPPLAASNQTRWRLVGLEILFGFDVSQPEPRPK